MHTHTHTHTHTQTHTHRHTHTDTHTTCTPDAVFMVCLSPQISVHPKLSIFLTYTSISGWLLPPAIHAEFRTFSMTPPDPEVVFGAHCTAMGFKSARILANKLMTLYNMIKEQLYVGQLGLPCSPAAALLSLLHKSHPHAYQHIVTMRHMCACEYHYGRPLYPTFF